MSFAATPIFLLMALVSYFQSPPMCTVAGDYGFLSTMWWMYVIMGVVHASPWFWFVRSWLTGTKPEGQSSPF
jgi:hypothetical protein